jgi:hypothetical protein
LKSYWFTFSKCVPSNPSQSFALSYRQLSQFLHFSHQMKYFKLNQSVTTRFFPKGVMEFWSKNFYILNRNTVSYSLKGGILTKSLF